MRVIVWLTLALAAPASAQWPGFEDRSAAVDTARFDFGTAGGSNENYYDGDFGDFDGDGRIDRGVISRYGLLWNAGAGVMVPVSTQLRNDRPPSSSESLTGYLFGDEVRIGNDAIQWVDIDGDGDLDNIQGGNGEPFVVQENRGGRFAVRDRLSASAVQIVTTDLERDGDADVVAACYFASGPDDFSVFVNDGSGNFSEESAARGMAFDGRQIIGVASGDLDRDGDFDLLLVSHADREFWIMLNDGGGRFTRTRIGAAGRLDLGSGFTQGTNLGDIDGDGDLDAVFAMDDYAGSHTRVGHVVLVNDGAAAFAEESAARFDVEGFDFLGRLVGGNGKLVDVDYDGDLDFFAFTELAGPPINFQLFLNDGSGVFHYTRDGIPAVGTPRMGSDGTGADTDVADLDGDGSYDVWVGIAGGRVTTLFNRHRDPGGLAADLPRDVRLVSATAPGVTLSWAPPPFAANVRHYEVHRSLAAGVEDRDRPLLEHIALSRFEDEGFTAPITNSTTTAELRMDGVVLDGGRVEYTDRSARPGVLYHYTIVHVGTENTRSRHTAELSAAIPGEGGADGVAPELAIVGPSEQEWSAHPRIVATFADESGVDPSTLSITLDRDAGSIAAGTNLADLALVRTSDRAIVALGPEQAIAPGLVTLTVSIADEAGNVATQTRRFAVTIDPVGSPSAAIDASALAGVEPLDVTFTAVASDADGEIMRVEWYFGDGSTATGSRVAHRYRAGEHTVMLLVRDNSGAVATATATVSVAACEVDCEPPDAGSRGTDGGAAPEDRVPAVGGDGGCGCTTSRPAAFSGVAIALVGLGLIARRVRRRS